MFSATFPRKIEALARKVLKSPVEIVVGKRASAAVSVEQHVEVLSDDNSKFRRLLQLLGVSQSLSVLVFVQRQDDADRLFSALLKHGYPSLALHGGMDQFDRDTTMADFRNGVCRVLVATSVAARGLHVDNLDLVVNYDPPDHYEDYIHRIGRTGRAGRPGSAFTFLTNEDDRFAVELVRALEQSGAAVPLGLRQLKERFDEKVARGEAAPVTRNHGFGGSGFKFNEEEQQKHKAQRQAERKVYLSGDEDEQDAEVSEDETAGERDASKDNSSKDALPPVTGPLPKGSGNKSNVTLHATDAKLEAAKAKAMQVVAAISQRSANSGSSGLVPTSMPGLPSASRGDRSTSTSVGEFEINDFPQVVRWRIVNKDAVSELQDRTGCAITPKGEFVNPKAKAQADQRKLYLLIEGPSPQHVEHCLEELRSIADRQMAKYAVQAERASARYKVV
jgi:ATP-dependent RNA helicase DDX46/PRP5